MPDQSQELQILITTKAELAGAKAVEQSLEQSIGKAKALGDSAQVKKLSEELVQVRTNMARAVEANKDLGKAEEETAGFADKLEKSHRAVHEGLHEIGNTVAPGAGRALITAFEGPLGPVTALGMGIGIAVEKLQSWNEKIVQAGENAATADFAASLDAVNKAVTGGIANLEAYANHIVTIYANEKGIAEQLQQQLTLMNAIPAARESARKAAEGEAQANLEKRKAMGQITPEQAAIEETANAVSAARAEDAAKRKQETDTLAELKQKQAKGLGEQPGLDEAYRAAFSARLQQENHNKRLEDQFGGDDEQWKKKQEDFRKTNNVTSPEAAQKAFDEASRQKERSGNDPLYGGYYQNKYRAAQQELEHANRIQNELNMGRRQYQATQTPEAAIKLQDQHDAEEKAKTDADKNAGDTIKITNDIAALEAKMESTRAAQDAEFSSRIAAILEGAVAKIVAMPQGGNLAAGITAADVVERGRDPGAQADEFIVRLANALGAHTQNIKAAADYLEQFKNDSAGFLEAVSRLTGQVLTANGKAITALGEQVKAAEELARQAKEGNYNH